jgi:hypothetical protein
MSQSFQSPLQHIFRFAQSHGRFVKNQYPPVSGEDHFKNPSEAQEGSRVDRHSLKFLRTISFLEAHNCPAKTKFPRSSVTFLVNRCELQSGRCLRHFLRGNRRAWRTESVQDCAGRDFCELTEAKSDMHPCRNL